MCVVEWCVYLCEFMRAFSAQRAGRRESALKRERERTGVCVRHTYTHVCVRVCVGICEQTQKRGGAKEKAKARER